MQTQEHIPLFVVEEIQLRHLLADVVAVENIPVGAAVGEQLFRARRLGVKPVHINAGVHSAFQNLDIFSIIAQVLVAEDEHLVRRKLAALEQAGKLRAIVTQNIDGLHQKAGSKCVYELHGSVYRNYCEKCGKFYPPEYIRDSAGVPRCTCGGRIKPDVVLYEESLDQTVIEGAVRAIADAEVLIVGGTSLTVYPAAGLIRYYRGNKLVLINRDETPYDTYANLIFRDPIGKVLGAI